MATIDGFAMEDAPAIEFGRIQQHGFYRASDGAEYLDGFNDGFAEGSITGIVRNSGRSGLMQEAQQNTITNVRVFMRSTTTQNGLPGLVLTVKAAKSGEASLFNIAPVQTDLGGGWYNLELTAVHMNTPGIMSFQITGLGAYDNNDLVINVVNTQSHIDTLLTASATILTVTDSLRKASYGRWKIDGTQLIIYDDDGVTPLETFDLKDDTGAPTNTKIFERTPVP